MIVVEANFQNIEYVSWTQAQSYKLEKKDRIRVAIIAQMLLGTYKCCFLISYVSRWWLSVWANQLPICRYSFLFRYYCFAFTILYENSSSKQEGSYVLQMNLITQFERLQIEKQDLFWCIMMQHQFIFLLLFPSCTL